MIDCFDLVGSSFLRLNDLFMTVLLQFFRMIFFRILIGLAHI